MLFTWGILARRLTYHYLRRTDNIFQRCYMVWHSSTTMSVNMFWNFAAKMSSSLYFPSPISRSTSSFVDTMMEGILSSFISSICFNICTFLFLLLLHRVDISDFRQIKAGRQNCNNFLFRLRKINSSLYLLISPVDLSQTTREPLHRNSRRVLTLLQIGTAQIS